MTEYELNNIVDYKIIDIKKYDAKEVVDKNLPICGLKLDIVFTYKNPYNGITEEIQDEYTYITKSQFNDYFEQLISNKIKGISLEKYYIGEINRNVLSDNLTQDKIELLIEDLNNTELKSLENYKYKYKDEEYIQGKFILQKNIFTKSITFNNLNIDYIGFSNNKFEKDFKFRKNNVNDIRFQYNKFENYFYFYENDIKNITEFWYCIFNYSHFYKNKYKEDICFEKCKFVDCFRLSEELCEKRMLFTEITAEHDVQLSKSEFNKKVLFSSGVYKSEIHMEELNFNNKVEFDRTIIKNGLFIYSTKIRDEFYLDTIGNKTLLSIKDCQLDSILYINEQRISAIRLIGLINNGKIEVKSLMNKGKGLIEKCINTPKNRLDECRYKFTYKQIEHTDLELKNMYRYIENQNKEIKETLLAFKDNFKSMSKEEVEDNFYYEYKRFDIRPYYHNIYRKKDNIGKIENIKGFIENFKINKFFYKNKGKKYDLINFINQYIFEVVGGFGTKPKSIFTAMLTIILIFGLIYYNLGIAQFIGPQDYNIMINIDGIQTTNLKFYGDELSSTIKSPLVAAIYFSFIIFFGEINAWNDITALVVAFEAMLGVGLISYLSFAIIRKIIR